MDIAKCEGTNCPLKTDCYRYTAQAGTIQDWLMEIPYKNGECSFFWKDIPNLPHIEEELNNTNT